MATLRSGVLMQIGSSDDGEIELRQGVACYCSKYDAHPCWRWLVVRSVLPHSLVWAAAYRQPHVDTGVLCGLTARAPSLHPLLHRYHRYRGTTLPMQWNCQAKQCLNGNLTGERLLPVLSLLLSMCVPACCMAALVCAPGWCARCPPAAMSSFMQAASRRPAGLTLTGSASAHPCSTRSPASSSTPPTSR